MMFLQSIRWRLQLWHGAILLCVIGALCGTVYKVVWDGRIRSVDREIRDMERRMVGELLRSVAQRGERFSAERFFARLESGEVAFPADIEVLFEGTEAGYTYFVLGNHDGEIVLQSENSPETVRFLELPEKGFSDDALIEDGFRKVRRSSEMGIRTVIGRDLEREKAEMRRFSLTLGSMGLAVWLAGSLGGWFLAGRMMKPIRAISQTAERISAGDLEERIESPDSSSELGKLCGVLNETFSRLHDSFEAQRRFVADASHELRTPVTILLSETARIKRKDRSVGEYQDALATCEVAAQRMRRLIESLLELAKQEAAGVRSSMENCNLQEIVASTVAELRPLSDEAKVTVRTDVEEVWIHGSAFSLSVMLTNLIANAVQHSSAGGRVSIVVRRANDAVEIEVSDEGEGIPEADLPFVFDRFYRADKARTAGQGRTGLGLAIARSVALNHRGEIEASNRGGGGALFRVRFPVNR